jgi:hypothetical protein
MAAFPCVWVQPANVDLRLEHAKFGFQVLIENADNVEYAVLGNSTSSC